MHKHMHKVQLSSSGSCSTGQVVFRKARLGLAQISKFKPNLAYLNLIKSIKRNVA